MQVQSSPMPSKPRALRKWPSLLTSLRQHALRGVALGVLSACSCTQFRPQTAAHDPFLEPRVPVAQAESPRSVPTGTDSDFNEIQQVSHFAPAARGFAPTGGGPAAGRVRLGNTIQPVAAAMPAVDPLLPAIEHCPPDPRLGAVIADGGLGFHHPGAVVCDPASPLAYPDEYLFDGGDRGLPVHYTPYARQGLETEDTIAEYEDEFGREHMKPSNRVAIYAPRFGAVMTVSAANADFGVDKLSHSIVSAGGTGLRAHVGSTWHAQREGSEPLATRSRPSGIETEAGQRGLNQALATGTNAKTLNVFEERSRTGNVQLAQSSEAQLALGIQAAITWTRTQFPTISANAVSAHEGITEKISAVFAVAESMDKPGRLEIVKLADKRTALPGDIVTFTIHYENLGDRELRNINIVDNLTPRLQYIEDSATSDRAGRLVTEDNQEGSLILRWELDEPLPGRTRGTVTFQARVR